MSFQFDLFAPKPRTFDEKALVRRLLEAEDRMDCYQFGTIPPMSRAKLKRLMTPLPRITVLD